MSTVNIRIGNLLGLNKGVQLLLPVLEAHGEIGRPFGAPKEIEIVTKTLMLIEARDCAEHAILSFERNRGILIHDRFLRRRARKRSWRKTARFPRRLLF